MKKPPKRYTKPEEIIKLIDKVKARQMSECALAEELDAKADRLFQWIALQDSPKLKDTTKYHESLDTAKFSRREAARLRRYQGRHAKKLERLKATLAALETVPMGFLEDPSVVEQQA